MNTELRNAERDAARFRLRIWAVGALVLLAFALIVWRLTVLQVQRYEDLAEQAESNRTAVVPIVPMRGQILDRNGVVLATNYSAYTLEITPSRTLDLEATIDALSKVVDIQPRDRRRFKRLADESRRFDSLPIRTRLTDEEVARFTAQRWRFPGVEVKARLFRSYPLGEVGSHAIGYIGRINQKEKERIEDSDDAANYRGTDYIGKLGIEQSYEEQLHGQTGFELLETSAGGYAVRRLETHPATPGSTLILSLDIRLQKLVEDLYGERRGALVAIDPRNGEVLALVSKPTFDPNLFVEGIDQENWQALNESINKPLLNRALRGTYPPGSTYKPFMALGALQLGKRDPKLVINDPGFYVFGGHTFRSHEGGLGGVDMTRAIQFSSNTYFYSLAVDMGVNAIHDFMAPLGFGQLTGIDLGGEVRGLLPSTEWKKHAYKRADMKKWFPGETVSLGIGQGYNSFTMLQLAVAESILANGGTRYRPHVARAVKDQVTGQVSLVSEPAGVTLGFKEKNLAIVRNALAAVNEAGTGKRVFAGAPYTSAGKTGTAQAVSLGQNVKYNARLMEEHQRDHSLFAAFAPLESPRIVVAAIVENAGFGAAAAGPIVRRVFDYWLLGQYPSEEDVAAVARGQASAPIGTPRRAEDVPLAGGAQQSAPQ
ncbi:MAG: penicillin-binding protein 2 [Comamonas sp. SCN 67-35]|uniref:penicillin-binding protein 2 n=1 Tax=unclassified Comamonas TaxID=2638500 RepID=UPI000868F1BC|nr:MULTISPECIES: penicillin-binding protein 2 [unclassified Comamonas]MBN9330686.1 penicillin-binding protein 2 [Comamonas sp.]ODU39927.1 MAG: penicillin-binding protein 2 [Comamonas sp. SCN 67-35]OJW97989.1 MAG: penicillin-binding protein 2 [Burkholderiales bacterium 66-26]